MNFAVNQPSVSPTISRIVKRLAEVHSDHEDRMHPKLMTIKSIRVIWPTMGLKEAKELYEWVMDYQTPSAGVLQYLLTVEV